MEPSIEPHLEQVFAEVQVASFQLWLQAVGAVGAVVGGVVVGGVVVGGVVVGGVVVGGVVVGGSVVSVVSPPVVLSVVPCVLA